MTSAQTPSGTIAGSVLPIRRAEELIATIPGVLSVRIVPNETGAVDEIHVLTTDLVLPKNSVRNIESALMAQLGLRVNHRKISIATTLGTPRAADLPPASPASSGLSAVAGGVSSFSPAAAMPAVAPSAMPSAMPTAAPHVSPAPAVSATASVASASPDGHTGGTVRTNAALAPMADAASAGRRALTEPPRVFRRLV